ncbi:MAG: Ig-like protein, partial [Candidatus Hydrogenedentes bacterium]|nr:Ig-like protein [Candidatus Hydrogenedentota bacterium]
GDLTNLVCDVTTPSVDPEGDPVQYRFEWYRKASAAPSFTLFLDTGFLAATNSQINNTDTIVGDTWYCVVTPFDGDLIGTAATSGNCTIVLGGTTPSSITLGAAPLSITLGESLTATGSISPVPPGGAVVTFTSTSPSGVVSGTFPDGVVIPAGAYTKTFWPTEASEGRAPWSFTASWPGDATYMSATSAPVSFTVLKKQPSLSLSLSATSAPMPYDSLTATAVFNTGLPPILDGLRAGVTLHLYMKRPDGSAPSGLPLVAVTDASGVATFGPGVFSAAGIAFDAPGTWQFLAEYVGDVNFKQTTSVGYDLPATPRLTIKDRAGYAVIVVGKLDANGEGRVSHAKTGDFIYRAFRTRGFADEDIYYLREGPVWPAADIYVDNTAPSQAGVQYAIDTWARDAMNATPAPLYVVFVDHGSTDAFYVYSGAYDETRVITPAELKGYFDGLTVSLIPAAQVQPVVFVYGACYSGSFVGPLSQAGRTIVTSCLPGEVSHRGVKAEGEGERDGEVFLTEFLRFAQEGKTLKLCFELASDKVREYTFSSSNGAAGQQTQHPLLDDNGDGAGTSGPLSFSPGYDGAVAHGLILGYGVNAGDPVGWVTVTPTKILAAGAPVGLLEGRVSVSPATGCEAWIEVKTPAYLGSTAADPLLPQFQQVVDMPVFQYEPAASDLNAGWFRWQDFGTTFDAPGTYQVFYYVKDLTTGKTNTYMLTSVYRESVGNQPPTPVALYEPADGATVHSSVFFAWSSSTDPENDDITYRLEVSEDGAFTAPIVREGLLRRYAILADADGINDLTDYYWRVIAVDAYGAESTPNDVWAFHVDNNNDIVAGTIFVAVTDASTGDPIEGATVDVAALSFTEFTDEYGETHFTAQPRTDYGVAVIATGYASQAKTKRIDAGAMDMVNFALTPVQTYVDGDWIRNPANGHYYKLTAALPWDQAQAMALTWGGYLTTVNDDAENAWQTGIFGLFGDLYIGLNDLAVEGAFTWANAEPAVYRNWDAGEPNGGALYDAVGRTPAGFWRDVNGVNPRRAIVESSTPHMNVTGPSGGTAFEGGQYTFQVEVRNPYGTVTYQWSKDGVEIDGEEWDTYIIDPAALTDEGSYT